MGDDRPIELWDDDIPTVEWTTSFRVLVEVLLALTVVVVAATWIQMRPETTAERLAAVGWPLALLLPMGAVIALLAGFASRHARVDGTGIRIKGRDIPAAAVGEVLVLLPEQAREVMGERPGAPGPRTFEGRRISMWRTAYRWGDDRSVLVFEQLEADGTSTYGLYSLPEHLAAEQVADILRAARDRAHAQQREAPDGGEP